MVAYVREQARLPLQQANLTVIEGTLQQTSHLAKALQRCTAVLCCLGTHQLRKVQFMQEHLPLLAQAMQLASVNRLILLSAFGVGQSYAKANGLAKLAYRTLVKSVYQDKALSEQALAKTDLTTTLILPTVLNLAPLSDQVMVKPLTQVASVNGLAKVGRTNVAKAMLDCVTDKQSIGQQLVVAPAEAVRYRACT
ncbi:NAD(P)-dependent oxidoreductase [Volucribacter amazonae]|uniref:NAD(P)-binding domain-containing protein n=1 Tax=Volucribacter amazonae TaxID=256731 RepID=A0A9X4PDI9_9PAST|nr:SDR family oxidoreductase [Volucribacter amazonae]MDG6895576.1 hypothetical protein [Volucribacter amazonae]